MENTLTFSLKDENILEFIRAIIAEEMDDGSRINSDLSNFSESHKKTLVAWLLVSSSFSKKFLIKNGQVLQ